jgi:hypothetical protein
MVIQSNIESNNHYMFAEYVTTHRHIPFFCEWLFLPLLIGILLKRTRFVADHFVRKNCVSFVSSVFSPYTVLFAHMN